jgi:hypothetical protein
MSNDNVTEFTGETRLKTPVPKILASAAGARLEDVVIVGWRENGDMYFASSSADGANVNWLLDMAKQALLGCGND